MTRAKVSGHELRLLADRASAAGQDELSIRLHDVAREQEAREAKAEAAPVA